MLVAETRDHLQNSINKFEIGCESMRLKINIGKRKVLVIKNEKRESYETVRVSGKEMKEVEKYSYLGVMLIVDSGMGEEVAHRVLEGRKVWGTMVKLWKVSMISREVKWDLYEK